MHCTWRTWRLPSPIKPIPPIPPPMAVSLLPEQLQLLFMRLCPPLLHTLGQLSKARLGGGEGQRVGAEGRALGGEILEGQVLLPFDLWAGKEEHEAAWENLYAGAC